MDKGLLILKKNKSWMHLDKTFLKIQNALQNIFYKTFLLQRFSIKIQFSIQYALDENIYVTHVGLG
jgi:hypothetical protein